MDTWTLSWMQDLDHNSDAIRCKYFAVLGNPIKLHILPINIDSILHCFVITDVITDFGTDVVTDVITDVIIYVVMDIIMNIIMDIITAQPTLRHKHRHKITANYKFQILLL